MTPTRARAPARTSPRCTPPRPHSRSMARRITTNGDGNVRLRDRRSERRSRRPVPRTDRQPEGTPMTRTRRQRRGEAGFTLIELMVVATIIGILAAIAVVQQRHAITKAQEAALRDDLMTMRKAIDDFYA